MTSNEILFPVMALVGWTFAVLLLIPFYRFRAAFRKQVVVDDFKFGESASVPSDVSIPNRNYMNLLELPVLFYVGCLTAYVSNSSDGLMLTLAWTYVVLRMLHSVVHLTYNNVIHRLSAFAASNLVLAALWIRILLALS